MGDDCKPVAGGYLYRSVDDGEWESLGFVNEGGISLSGGDDDMEVWQGVLSAEPVTVVLKPHWWALNNLYKLVIGRPKYTVPMLRRWNKGHRRK